MELEAMFRRPKALGKGPRQMRPCLPDVDNIAKALLDAASGRCFTDDRQVTFLMVTKWYCAHDEDPFVRFRVWKLTRAFRAIGAEVAGG